MKKNLTIIGVVLATILLSSCNKEESLLSQNEITNPSDQALHRSKSVKSSLIAVPHLSPCGYGFSVTFTSLGTGAPITAATAGSPYYYEIYEGGSLVDYGELTPAATPQNTNWVLNPCTSHEFRFWGYGGGIVVGSAGTITSIQSNITSDGCGGIFVC